MKHDLDQLRTWIELDAKAAKKNYDTFRRIAGGGGTGAGAAPASRGHKVQLWSVVKSNAYGHGLFAFSQLMDEFGVDGFCVDSIVEAVALRRTGIKRQILVLGQTLPSRFAEAAAQNITITISNFEALRALGHSSIKKIPDFHVKIDTGMHRQGFYTEDVSKVAALIKKTRPDIKKSLKGIFTHFASAKDINYPTYTDEQLKNFKKAVDLFEKAGFINLTKHASATGGALISPKYHFDAIRVGIGLYGIWPSKELELQLGGGAGSASMSKKSIQLHPVLSWRAVVGEVKPVKKGDYIGYNTTERMSRATNIAIIPIGYWHGFPWALSGSGEVIIRGKRVRVLGRVSMDMIAVGPVPLGTKPGDIATLIGRGAGKNAGRASKVITAEEQAAHSRGATFNYELLTRLNPLMERVIIR